MKIGIVGAFSSGKTTLAKEVSAYLLNYKWDIIFLDFDEINDNIKFNDLKVK